MTANSFGRSLLIYIISLQMALLPLAANAGQGNTPGGSTPDAVVRWADTNIDVSVDPGLERLISVVNAQDLRNPKFLGADPDRLTKQVHRVINSDGTEVEYPLHQIDINNEAVGFNGIQLRTIYLPKLKELQIQKVLVDRQGNGRVTDVHAFQDIELTSNVLQDDNFIFFATSEGIHCIVKPLLYGSLFQAPVPAPIVIPAPPVNGAKISDIEFSTRGGKGNKAGDLYVTVDAANDHQEVPISNRELILAIRSRLLITYGLVQVANGDVSTPESAQQLLSTFQEVAQELQAHGQAIQENPASADNVRRALVNIGQRNQDGESTEVLKLLLAADSNGQDSFQRLANANRDTFTDEESIEARDVIKKYHDENPTGKLSDREVLVNYYREQAGLALLPEKERNLSAWQKLKAYLTPQRLKKTGYYLAGATAGYALDSVTDGASKVMILNVVSSLVEWINHVPVLNLVTTAMVDRTTGHALGALYENWAVTRAVVGLGVLWSIYPLSFWIGKFFAKVMGEDFPMKKALFAMGIRLYGLINWAFQKGIWEQIAGQRSLYKSLEKNHFSLTAFSPPREGAQAQANRAVRINEEIDSEAKRKTVAMLVAARVVSTEQDVDLASLLMVGFGKQVSSLAKMASEPVEAERWQRITELARRTEASLVLSNESGAVDPNLVQDYENKFRQIASQLKTPGPIGKFGQYLNRKGKEFGRWIFDLVLFGTPGLKIYRQFRDVQLDDDTVKVADHAYRDDYFFSEAAYMMTDPGAFGDVGRVTLGAGEMLGGNPFPPIGWAPRILSDGGEQAGIYGMQGAVDPLSAATAKTLTQPAGQKPLANDIYADAWNRPQTFGEAVTAVATTIAKADSTGYFKNHQNYIRNLFNGFQVRSLIGGSLRFLSLWAGAAGASAVMGDSSTSVPGMMVLAMVIQSWFLIDKVSFHLDPNTGIRPGYATIWSYVHLAVRQALGVANNNRQRIQNADFALDSGIKTGDGGLMIDGIRQQLQNFKDGKRELPEKFRLAPEDYSPELGIELLEYARKTPSLPTVESWGFMKTANVGLGAAFSTALYTLMSRAAFAGGGGSLSTNLHILLAELGVVAVSYAGLEGAQHLSNFLWDQFRPGGPSQAKLVADANPCEKALGEQPGLPPPKPVESSK